jgi:integrase/recombinase XerD
LQVVRSRKSIGVKTDMAVGQFMRQCRAKNLSPETIRWYEWQLGEFMKYPDAPQIVTLIRSRHIIEFLSDCQGKVAPNTLNGRYRALSALFGFLLKEGIIEENPIVDIDKPKVEKVLIRIFTEEELQRFFRVIDRTTFHGIRDYAMFLLLFDTGIRVKELINIRQKDLFLSARHLYVMGKGNKERLIPFGEKSLGAINQYLQIAGKNEHLFLNEYDTQIQYRTIDNTIKKYGKYAGITDKRVSCHTFRLTFAVNYLRNGGDTRSLQEILGHSSYAMVQRYTQLLDEDLKLAHGKASPGDRLKV